MDRLHRLTILSLSVVLAIIFTLLIVALATSESKTECLERGGVIVDDGTMIIYQQVGKILVPQVIPQWHCEP